MTGAPETVRPAGRVSVKSTSVMSVELLFVRVIVTVAVPPKGMVL